jgi:hypothetical protein
MSDPNALLALAQQVEARTWPDELDQATLLAGFTDITGLPSDSVSASTFEDCFLDAVGQAGGNLEMRPGGWKVNVSASLVKLALTTALMTGVMWEAGFDQLPAYVLPAVLPLVVDVERATLSREQKTLLMQLRSAAVGSTGAVVQPAVLYSRLPQSVQDQVSPLDFEDFVQALIEAGEVDDAGYTDVRLRLPADPAWLRITWT